ncbi:NHLP leader peptide family RiPP precursor [Polaribacter sp. Q13]|uniref:NHLP leader peptide family RiPP precursor n=1 Tax=Polaribacter sp. Q13 TaxID=2806551 RepID=UPI00193AE9B8|nr:NHLP leader peptide family RiPP precursor [Polaribacter sp. Q13]QVY64637.1 NHLP leader peptide family RiPP precursor [Polaribacter sp. Q13]
MKITKTQELLQSIIQKAWEDEAFKQELIANPVKAIEELTGKKINLPEGKTIVVKDQTDKTSLFINIPAQPNMENMELTEAQLEAVAGGSAIPMDNYDSPFIHWISKIFN